GVDASGSNITQIQYSTDGGSTWATANGQLQNNNLYTFNAATSSASPTTDSGLTLNFSLPSSGTVKPAIGDQFTFTANNAATVTASAITGTATGAGNTAGTISNTGAGAAGTYVGPVAGAVSIVATTSAATVTGVTMQVGTSTYTLDAANFKYTGTE